MQAARTHGGSDNITAVVVDVVVGEDEQDDVGAGRGRRWPPTSPVPRIRCKGFTGHRGRGRRVPGARLAAEPAPSRRERRRARRRERRLARGRRLITFRTFIFIILLAAVLVGAYAAVRWYDINSYFVGVQNNELVIYQGRVGGFLWYHPVEVERTGVTTADVPASTSRHLSAGVEETSVADARAYVSNLVNGQDQSSRTRRRRLATTTTAPRAYHDHDQGAPDGTTDPPTRGLHAAVLRGPVRPAEQHPGAQVQRAGQRPQQSRGCSVQTSQTRGEILSRRRGDSGRVGAGPGGSIYKYQRVYNPYTAHALRPGRRASTPRSTGTYRRRIRVQQLPHAPHPAGQDLARPAGQPHRSRTTSP